MNKQEIVVKKLINLAQKQNIYLVIRFQQRRSRTLDVKNGIIDNSTINKIEGTGLQAFTKSGNTGFSSVDSINNERRILLSLNQAIRASEISQEQKFEPIKDIFNLEPTKGRIYQSIELDPFRVETEKIEQKLLSLNNRLKKRYSKYSISNTVNFTSDHWKIFRSDGTNVEFKTFDSILFTFVNMTEEGNQNELLERVHGLGYEILKDKKYIDKLTKRLDIKLSYVEKLSQAPRLKGGNYPVIIDGEMAGVFAHEAFGHTAEGDNYYQKSPLLKNGKIKKGQKIACSFVNIFDEAKAMDRGFSPFSSYGNRRRRIDIIKSGKINDLISDVVTANKTGVQINGGARSEKYYSVPVPRMSCTNILLEKSHRVRPLYNLLETTIEKVHKMLIKENIFKKHKKIIYLAGSTGGQVNSFEGNFQFSSVVSFRMQKNKIDLIKPVSFSGKTLSVLESVELSLGKQVEWPGFCGKSGQSAIVNAKAPALLLSPNKEIIIV